VPFLRDKTAYRHELPNSILRRTIRKLAEVTTEMYNVPPSLKAEAPSVVLHVSREEENSVHRRPEHVSISLSPKRTLDECRKGPPVERNNERDVQRRSYGGNPDTFFSKVSMQHVRS